jgi:hypothetical protein
MTKFVRFTLHVTLLVALSFMRHAWATSFSNDQSDLWWNASENGWGIQFVQRGKTMFATMFDYDSSGNPTWYVATLDGSKPGGVLTFTGDLYAAHGTWFGAIPYDPKAFGATKVGTMTWQKSAGEPGTLTYSVGGVNVMKSLTRQPIGTDDFTGSYTVGLHLVAAGCSDPAKNGPLDGTDVVTVAQIGTAITLTFAGFGCTYSGTYAQSGQFGSVSGTFTCTSGDAGTFSLGNMIATPVGMVARVSGTSTRSGCQDTGQIGGVRRDL